jgi:protein TonB
MSFSHTALSAAMGSCALHIVLLGLAAAVVIPAGHSHLPVLTVSVLQSAAPLPVGGDLTPSSETPSPAPAPASAVTPPLEPLDVSRRPRTTQPRASVAALREADVPDGAQLLPQPGSLSRTVIPSLLKEHALPTGLILPPLAGVELNGAALAAHRFLQGQHSGAPGFKAGDKGAHGKGEGHGPNGSLSAQPAYGVNPKPPYPFVARRAGAQGVVLLRVRVRANGTVAEVQLAHSSGFAPLDDSALQTVRERWRFVPARQGGVPVESWVEVPIQFVLAAS